MYFQKRIENTLNQLVRSFEKFFFCLRCNVSGCILAYLHQTSYICNILCLLIWPKLTVHKASSLYKCTKLYHIPQLSFDRLSTPVLFPFINQKNPIILKCCVLISNWKKKYVDLVFFLSFVYVLLCNWSNLKSTPLKAEEGMFAESASLQTN